MTQKSPLLSREREREELELELELRELPLLEELELLEEPLEELELSRRDFRSLRSRSRSRSRSLRFLSILRFSGEESELELRRPGIEKNR